MNVVQIGRFAAPALALAVFGMADATSPVRAAHPGVSPDASQIAFSWQGDVWVVSSAGGRANRLTIHPATDVMPRWTPDGARIVFVSDRYGNNDVFSMRADGTDIKRLTFESSAEQITCVSPDGAYVYGYTSAWGRSDIFRVPIGGGELVRLTNHPIERAYYPSITPDNRSIIYNAGGSAGLWRNPHQSGSNTGEIWVSDLTIPLSKSRNLTRNEFNDLFPMVAPDGTISFMSNRSGWPNLWRMGRDGSNPKQLTRHQDGTLRWPSMSANGKLIAYEFNSRLWTYDVASGKSSELKIEVPGDSLTNPEAIVSLDTGVGDYAVSPDSKRIVLAVRGDLYLIAEKGGVTRRLTTDPAVDAQPLWLDSETILYVNSGRNGKRELLTVNTRGEVKPFLSDARDLTSPALSPDGKTLALHRGDSEVCTVPAKGGVLKVVARGNFIGGLWGTRQFSWSHDSEWLALDVPTDRGSNVVLHNLSSGKDTIVARLARGGSTPRFLSNGKGVYFTAQEYTNSDLFVVDLTRRPVTFAEDDLDGIVAPKPKPQDVKVEVEERGIEDRMRRLTTRGASGALASPDSREIWTNIDGRLTSVSVATGTATAVAGSEAGGSNLQLDANGTKLYMTMAGKLYGMRVSSSTSAEPSGASERGPGGRTGRPGAPAAVAAPSGGPAPTVIPFSAEATIDLREEERALFGEVGWALDRFYYDPKFHGKSWDAIRGKFEKILPFVADRRDFYALIDEMMEELDSSHIGSTPPRAPTGAALGDETALLGVEWDWARLDKSKAYFVASVLEDSPAAHPSSTLLVGDRLVSVDGTKVGAGRTVAELLNRKVGKRVVLTVDRDGKEREITIKPASPGTRNGLNYESWVRQNRAAVEKLSNGELTYVHIQGMNQTSHDLFLRQIRTLTIGKKGLIIDVRYNGGGSTAQQALNVLIKSPWLVRTQRGALDTKLSENIYRGDSLELPSALLINQHSFSNAEVFAEGFRKLKIGPVIGERTAGGVIGTGSYELWDGGQIRMPGSGAYAIDGENLEGNGRKPDIAVEFDPNAWTTSGRDVVLERAVAELMKRIR